MLDLIQELVENPRRLRVASIKGAAAGTYYPDPSTATTGTLHGFNNSATIFDSEDEVVVFAFRVNHSAVLATAILESTDGNNIVATQMVGGAGGGTEVEGPIYVRGGFRVTTNNFMALTIVYAVLR